MTGWAIPSTRDLSGVQRQIENDPSFDSALEVEVQTDKTEGKAVPCRGCRRPLVVNRFYSPGQASCKECGLSRALVSGSGTSAIVTGMELQETKARYPECRCEEFGLHEGFPLADLRQGMGMGCTGGTGLKAGHLCLRLDAIRRSHSL